MGTFFALEGVGGGREGGGKEWGGGGRGEGVGWWEGEGRGEGVVKVGGREGEIRELTMTGGLPLDYVHGL